MLLDPLKYEFEVFHKPHRLRTGPAFKVQRLLRHILNTTSTFSCSLDAQRLDHLTLLRSDTERIRRVAAQMEECLKGLQLMLQGRVQVQECVWWHGVGWRVGNWVWQDYRCAHRMLPKVARVTLCNNRDYFMVCPRRSALAALEAMAYQTEHLFLHFLMEHLNDELSTSRAQIIQTLGFISLLFNLSMVVR